MSTKVEKVRSKEDEEALDRKIAEIRKRNQLIQQRKEIVDEDRAAFEDQYGSFSSLKSPKKVNNNNNNNNNKVEKVNEKKAIKNEWVREWDVGKTRAETWIENVPEMGLTWRGQKKKRGFYGRGRHGRGSGLFRRDYSMHDVRFEPASYNGKQQSSISKDTDNHSQKHVEERASDNDEAREQKHTMNCSKDTSTTAGYSRGHAARQRSRIYVPNFSSKRAARRPNTLIAISDRGDDYEKSVEIVKRSGGLSDTIRVKLTNVNATKQQKATDDDKASKVTPEADAADTVASEAEVTDEAVSSNTGT